jgi:arylsulfatase A-like enzyme
MRQPRAGQAILGVCGVREKRGRRDAGRAWCLRQLRRPARSGRLPARLTHVTSGPAGSRPATPLVPAIIAGVSAWTAVGLAEHLLGSLLIALGPLDLLPARPPLAALWWYPSIGAPAGAVAAVLGRSPDARVRDRRFRSWLLLSVVAAFSFAGVVSIQTLTSRLALALCALVAGLALVQMRSRRGRLTAALDGLTPMTAAVLLSLPAWHRLNLPFPDARGDYSTTMAAIGAAMLLSVPLIAFVRARTSRAAPRPWLRAAAAIAAFATITLSAHRDRLQTDAAASAAPDVVLIVLDTVRADHLATYGYQRDTMPALSAFAAGATTYTHAVAAADMTISSHASMFTGVYPFRHGAYVRVANPVGLPMKREHPTLAEALAARAYRRRGIAANWSFLGPAYGFHRGFETYEWDPSSSVHVLERAMLAMEFGFSPPPYAQAPRITDKAIAAIDETRNAPSLIFLNYLDAHMPNAPPASYFHRFRAMAPPPLPAALTGEAARFTADELRQRIDWYDASLSYLDDHVARLLSHLRETGRYENALIIITSDHGELLGEEGLFGHGRGTHDALIRVPLVIKYPRQRTSARVDDVVSHVDIAPTVLDFAGAPSLALADGITLRSPAAPRPHPVLAMSFPEDSGVESVLFLDGRKLTVLPSGSVLERVRGALVMNPPLGDAERHRIDSLIAAASAMAPLGAARLTPEARERLRSLGYIR